MQNNPSKIVNIKEDIKEGLPAFYFDLQGKGIVLATTAKEGDYVPINTDKTNVPHYQVLRDRPKEFCKENEIFNQVNKIHLLNEILTKEDITLFSSCDLISPEQTKNIIYLLSGEDWIAYLDTNLEIHSNYIPRNDNRVTNELNIALEILNQKKEEYQQNETTNRNNNRI